MVSSNIAWALLASAAAVAGSARAPKRQVPGSYIVEFDDSVEFARHMEPLGETTRTFDYTIFKGAVVQFRNRDTTESQANTLLSLPCVKNIWPNYLYSLPETDTIWTGNPDTDVVSKRDTGSNDTYSPHAMTQVDRLRAEGFVGNGIKIAVIDTGIDYTHPALGGGFGPGHLVSYGYDLVGDSFNGLNIPVPDDDPYDDCEGHGTHVAGIIAAQANDFGFTGASPGVTLGAYRVFGCHGHTANDVLIEAYLRAYHDGSQIITCSIGESSGWSEDPWAVVVSRIVEAGIPCPLSIGNSGNMGLFYASTAADGEKATAIASFDNIESPSLLATAAYTLDHGSETQFGYVVGTPGDWKDVSLPLWTPSFNATDPSGGCGPYPEDTPDLSGYIVLARRGVCNYVHMSTIAAAHGAKYIMFYNNAAGASFVTAPVKGILASGMVTPEQGATWVSALSAGSIVELNLGDPDTAPVILATSENSLTGGSVSFFSSWGPTFEGDVKPQVGAPGGHILSLYPVSLGSYAVLSGTSMACPLVAAIIALIAEARGSFDPATIEHLITATAIPTDLNEGSGTRDMLAPVAQQGAGLIQAYDAAFATTVLNVSSLAFNDTKNFVDTLSFTISNLGREDVIYNIDTIPAATAYTFSTSVIPDIFPGIEFDNSSATLELSESKVTVPAGGDCVVSVTVTPPTADASRLPVYSGYITLSGTDGSRFNLPYHGILGSLQDAKVLSKGYLSLSTDSAFTPITASGSNTSFVIYKTNSNTTVAVQPVAVASMALGSPLIKYEIINAVSGHGADVTEILGSPVYYGPRDTLNAVWNGTLVDGSYAPAGKYRFRISALHIFGNASDASQYDVDESIEFTIAYA